MSLLHTLNNEVLDYYKNNNLNESSSSNVVIRGIPNNILNNLFNYIKDNGGIKIDGNLVKTILIDANANKIDLENSCYTCNPSESVSFRNEIGKSLYLLPVDLVLESINTSSVFIGMSSAFQNNLEDFKDDPFIRKLISNIAKNFNFNDLSNENVVDIISSGLDQYKEFGDSNSNGFETCWHLLDSLYDNANTLDLLLAKCGFIRNNSDALKSNIREIDNKGYLETLNSLSTLMEKNWTEEGFDALKTEFINANNLLNENYKSHIESFFDDLNGLPDSVSRKFLQPITRSTRCCRGYVYSQAAFRKDNQSPSMPGG